MRVPTASALLQHQRKTAALARYAFELDASAEERAKRRYNEIIARNGKADYNEIFAKVIERDRIDSTRDVAPLRAADDAVVLDSDKLTADEVFEQALALCK